jgi:demethylmenaquinone methyltransferase/2-methoxy-6-polyprenyl-1,4-benzoquinol methylase
VIYFTERGINPRKTILKLIPDTKATVLDMCCGTMGNSIEIAEKRKNVKIIGLDISANMLKIAKEKIAKKNIHNVTIVNEDATQTSFGNGSFDFIIWGLVLHETDEVLAKKILKEAYRLLNENGKLIVLEWEKSNSLLKRLLFSPIKVSEPKSFKKFFKIDKARYFYSNGYDILNEYHCDYSPSYLLIYPSI